MASGKQLSFQNGEVSPAQRFKSNAISYQQGLSKLTNMYVRRDGGVSNRSGLEYVNTALPQTGIPQPGGLPGVRGFVCWSAKLAKWVTIEYANYGTDGAPEYGFSIDGAAPVFSLWGNTDIGPLPSQARFTVAGEKVLLTPAMIEPDNANADVNVAVIPEDPSVDSNVGVTGALSVTSTVLTGTGTTPALPVSYLVMAILKNGEEAQVSNVESATEHPHGAKSVKVVVTLTAPYTAYSEVKQFVLYRAAGNAGLNNSFYKLVSRVPYNPGVTTITFADYGADDPSVTPAIDSSTLPKGLLSGANAAAYYQQRLILAMRETPEGTHVNRSLPFKTGEMVASKLGSPYQLRAPIITADTGAFIFSVPVTDGSPVVGLLAMERLLALTERSVYVIRGGEQGILTPTGVNPLNISEEGCSKVVEPKMSGKRGYFINNAHTKLMAIEFSADANLSVYEASLFSEHFLHEDIVQIEVLGGEEDCVFLVRRDGKLVRVTCGEDGIHGFALMETDGYIESIYRGKAEKPYSSNLLSSQTNIIYHDVLMCYVIRNGIRTLEKLVVRDDRFRQGEFFADCHKSFGKRLALNGALGYSQVDHEGVVETIKVNLKTDTTWIAGQDIKLQATDNFLDALDPAHTRVHLYYDVDGKENVASFIWDGDAATVIADGDFTSQYIGYLEVDVPSALQDVSSQSLTDKQKALAQTRWLTATDLLEGDDFLYGAWLASSSDPSEDGTAEVTVVADGEVISSPLNPNKAANTLSIQRDGGTLSLSLPDFFSWGYVGTPYTSEMETLDIEAGDNRTLTDAKKIINKVGLGLMETRGGFFGIPDKGLDEMEEIVFRQDGDITQQTQNKNGHIEVSIPTEWTEGGRVNIKNVDPVPMTILSVYPKGIAGD